MKYLGNRVENRLDLLSKEQIDWCDKHVIMNYPKDCWYASDDGKIYNFSKKIKITDTRAINYIEKAKSFPVEFGNCELFFCDHLKNLKSLKGCPQYVLEECINFCDGLENLNGISQKIGSLFVYECSNLKTLKGINGVTVNNILSLRNLSSLESIDSLKDVCIEEYIDLGGCPKIEKYSSILSDMSVFKIWQKSKYTADEFLKEYSGFIEAKKYGI